MFSGTTKKKTISFRGASKAQDKAELLRLAREERWKRQVEREKSEAILHIQRSWRRCREYKATKSSMLQEFDNKLRDLLTLSTVLSGKGAKFMPGAPALAPLLRIVRFFHTSPPAEVTGTATRAQLVLPLLAAAVPSAGTSKLLQEFGGGATPLATSAGIVVSVALHETAAGHATANVTHIQALRALLNNLRNNERNTAELSGADAFLASVASSRGFVETLRRMKWSAEKSLAAATLRGSPVLPSLYSQDSIALVACTTLLRHYLGRRRENTSGCTTLIFRVIDVPLLFHQCEFPQISQLEWKRLLLPLLSIVDSTDTNPLSWWSILNLLVLFQQQTLRTAGCDEAEALPFKQLLALLLSAALRGKDGDVVRCRLDTLPKEIRDAAERYLHPCGDEDSGEGKRQKQAPQTAEEVKATDAPPAPYFHTMWGADPLQRTAERQDSEDGSVNDVEDVLDSDNTDDHRLRRFRQRCLAEITDDASRIAIIATKHAVVHGLLKSIATSSLVPCFVQLVRRQVDFEGMPSIQQLFYGIEALSFAWQMAVPFEASKDVSLADVTSASSLFEGLCRSGVGKVTPLEHVLIELLNLRSVQSVAEKGGSDVLLLDPSAARMLSFALTVLSFALRSCNDKDFASGRPVALKTIQRLIPYLRDVLYRLCWADEMVKNTTFSARPQPVRNVATLAASVFNLLHERHLRRRLVPKDQWLWRNVPAEAFSAAAVLKAPRRHRHSPGISPQFRAFSGILEGFTAPPPPSEGLGGVRGFGGVGRGGGGGGGVSSSLRGFGVEGPSIGRDDLSSDAHAAEEAKADSTMEDSKGEAIRLVLNSFPQVIPFHVRAKLFQSLLSEESNALLGGSSSSIRIRRDRLYSDAMRELLALEKQGSHALKQRIQVQFINAQGVEEAGVDGGGLFKEFMDETTRMGFNPSAGFFLSTPSETLYPNPSYELLGSDVLEHYRFLGVLIGKAVHEGILVEPVFSLFFLNRLLGRRNLVDHLASYDEEYYKSLIALQDYTGDFNDLSLRFTIEKGGLVQEEVELLQNGASIPVTQDNVDRFILLSANYKLNTAIAMQCEAFLDGFTKLIPLPWLKMFDPHELQKLIGGAVSDFDVDDLAKYVNYGGSYHPRHIVIRWLWEVLKESTAEDRRKFLGFVTSVSRKPLLGFDTLAPRFGINEVVDTTRLPTSATCMNLLKLPHYDSKETLREKLLYSIRSGAGFELSQFTVLGRLRGHQQIANGAFEALTRPSIANVYRRQRQHLIHSHSFNKRSGF